MVDAGKLSRRERQIMDSLYRLETASAKEVMNELTAPPSYSTVRTILQKLLEKGHISYTQSGPRYVYFPLVGHSKASKTAMQNVIKTFFQDSPFTAVNSLLGMSKDKISNEELEKLSQLIEESKRQNRKKK